VERDFGYVLHVASTGVLQPSSAYAAYAAARSCLLSLGSALHYELRHTAVKCTVLCPGITRSDFFGAAKESLPLFHRLIRERAASAMLAGRRPATTEIRRVCYP
jgi:short-subunit dehydrogenase